MQVLTQAAERSEPYDSMPAPKDPAAPASMLVLARTTVHATSHGGGIFVSILHLLPYLQAVLTGCEASTSTALEQASLRTSTGAAEVSRNVHMRALMTQMMTIRIAPYAIYIQISDVNDVRQTADGFPEINPATVKLIKEQREFSFILPGYFPNQNGHMDSVEKNHATIKFNPEGQPMHGKRRGPLTKGINLPQHLQNI